MPALEPTGCWVGPGLGADYPSEMSASVKSSGRIVPLKEGNELPTGAVTSLAERQKSNLIEPVCKTGK